MQIEENEKAYDDILSQLDLKEEGIGIVLDGGSERKTTHTELALETAQASQDISDEFIEESALGTAILLQSDLFDNNQRPYLYTEKETRVAIMVAPVASAGNNPSTNQSTFSLSSQLKTDFSKSFMDSSQEQSTNQQQTNGQVISQSVMKLRANQELQVATQFKSILSEAENPNRIIGDLGIGLDRRSELPLAMQVVNTHARSAKWGQEVGKRLVYMVNKNVQEAKINITPEKLGPIQIKLSLDKDQQLSVMIHAQHGTTRELLENAIPKLRELLDETNANLASVDVGDGGLSQQEQGGLSDEQDSAKEESIIGQVEGVEQNVVYHSDNLVDYYA